MLTRRDTDEVTSISERRNGSLSVIEVRHVSSSQRTGAILHC
jgi:hypothetical protein